MRDNIFGVLQRVGRSFMLPIALLPVAGLLLGIGSSFTNQTMLVTYGLTGVIYEGGVLYTVLDIMNQCGSAVFNNLALLFAMGVAIGMARQEKEVAALSGAIAYLVMNTAISAMITARGGVEAMAANTTTSSLGITTLQMGVFGGIIAGLGVAALHNRFYKTQLPQVLSFFGGTRFVPIVCTAVFVVVGIAMFFIWPAIQIGIAALTAMLTGITEPLEFTFLFVAPLMYAVHCVYAGLAYMLMHILHIGVGMTFSGGLIDLTLFGILQGNAKTHWIWIVIVGLGYFLVYYFTFYLMITRMNLKTPGREEEGEETRLFTRSDFRARTGAGSDGGISALILKGLGGKGNLSDVDCCATRLRITVLDMDKVDDALLRQSGASGVIRKGSGVQVVYGPQVAVIKSNLVDFMGSPEADELDGTAISAAPALAKGTAEAREDAIITAHMNGTVVPLDWVRDEAFSSRVLGEGVAIEPADGHLYAPADGEIDNLFDTRHALAMVTNSGVELLLHVGINTMELGGKHFKAHVAVGQRVKRGDLLLSFDLEAVKATGYLCTTPMIVCNTDDYHSVASTAEGRVKAGAPLLEIKG